MRMRQTTSKLVENTRYLRLTATGGDGSYSVGEFAVFAKVPQGWPGIALTRAEGAAPDGGSSGWGVSLGVLAAAIAILIFLSRKRRPPAGGANPARGATLALMRAPGRGITPAPCMQKRPG